ncbi:anaerobic ribonucleoside-triphosphate reductase activating protein [Amedibacterium intestinale]|uniref:anaerobic ribonucleoside-triphosphate reductase activating protein n=1 Tax=Amedibacterium intestinale TaxID=2583452 RepID=UPI000E20B88A|nr:anaerobic ribonucleoside-triphosphate reductase activating protein [Amedibacterium intestinale]RHO19689.1 anaerobic ribonucleoside-triphosphate reductase activating protein [Eubacterium sp. AM18-26]RHO26270.1 anaerobic ribonucleoside-triphosphate reductase activating protein [Eubacterium sp. AM18-10LB-B]RHO29540.1 anaerobic ribonucleoside-triphosphate reductase activating protein [Erysipelotrichaceae bacterium AM17-60]
MDKNNYFLINISLLHRCGQKYYDKLLSDTNINASQVPFLILIYENEGISMQELAARGCFDKGTITKSIQKLEENGYVQSVPSFTDKRIRNLYTSEKAKNIIPQIYMIRKQWWERLTAGLDTSQQEQFSFLLNEISEKARTYNEADEKQSLPIFGIQKLTLLDYPSKMASTLFCGGCNMRCPFCHNKGLVFLDETMQKLDNDDILSFLRKRKNILEGVCISGGEPLLHDTLEPFLRILKSFGYSIKLDTNGSFPERLKDLIEKGLVDYVAMDIKNCISRYEETCGVSDFDVTPVKESVSYLMEHRIPYEFRTTLVKEFHDEKAIQEIGEWLKGADHYYLQNFKNSSSVIQSGLHSFEPDELYAFKKILEETIQQVDIRGID